MTDQPSVIELTAIIKNLATSVHELLEMPLHTEETVCEDLTEVLMERDPEAVARLASVAVMMLSVVPSIKKQEEQ